jgi:small basic protein
VDFSTREQMNLTDIYGTYGPIAIECTFFSCIHGISYSLDHTFGHKISLNNFKKNKIILE